MSQLLKNLTEEIDRLLGGEIKELKFGCWVETKNNGSKMITKIEYDNYFSAVNGGSLVMIPAHQIENIIGRPITLEDVMRAIEKSNYVDDKPIFTNEGQMAYFNEESGDMELTGIYWELGKPLSSQYLQIMKSIAEILGIKENG